MLIRLKNQEYLSVIFQAEAEDDADVAEPFYIIDNAKFEMVNSKYAMTTICNILMNLVVLENKVVEDAHIFYHLLKFIMNTLPSLENNGEVSSTHAIEYEFL